MLAQYNDRGTVYWTRQRVIAGLLRFHRDTGLVPLSTEDWRIRTLALQGRKTHDRPYPSFSAVLRRFRTFREAWTAVGLTVNRTHEEWTEVEDWYITEATGLITRVEIACDLNRTPDAVHRRLYDLGLNARTARGWSVNRVQQATGLTQYRLQKLMESGALPYVKGTQVWYLQPADVAAIPGIDWSQAKEFEGAARAQLLARLCGLLEAMR